MAGGHDLGTISGVLVPTCENMWGVLIFLRFFFVVGHAGVWQSLLIVFVSFMSSFFTTMSLSAMATNGPVEAGGAYFIISRALGHKLGGAVGCTYYLGLSLLAVLEVLGAVEVMLYVEPGLDAGAGVEGAVRLWAVILLIGLAVMVWGGMKLVSQLGIFFAAVVGLTLTSYYAGLIAAPLPGTSSAVTGLSSQTLKDNWSPAYTDGVTFSDVLSVFFPCFTGILGGANRANALKDPAKSIPWGTLAAITLSLCMYTSYMIMWGAVADREYLKYGPGGVYVADGAGRRLLGGGGGGAMSVVSEIAWPWALPTQIGIIIASLSQALQCLISAPRILNAIAADGTVPFLNVAAKLNDRQEPAVALAMTTGLCLVASMIGSLDLVAPLLSICFLSAYAALNFSTFVLGLTRAPSWRPTWRYFHWSLGLAGFLLCTTLAFVIKWYFALVAVAMLGFLVAYIESRQVQVDWGSALGGIRLDLATSAMLDLAHERKHSSNWRPQLLCLPGWPMNPEPVPPTERLLERKFSKPPSFRERVGLSFIGGGMKVTTTQPPKQHVDPRDALLKLATQLKKGRGLCVVAEVEEGELGRTRGLSTRVSNARDNLEVRLQNAGVRGFAHVVVAENFRAGKAFAIQGIGFGGLEPNTVMLGWPRRNHIDFNEDVDADNDDPEREEAAKILVETVCECTAAEKAVLLCLGLDEFPSLDERVTGFVDVWWVVHDGGLLLMIAHLLLRHRTWSGCKLRVHTVLQSAQDPAAVRRGLQKVLSDFRIEAEVCVVEAGEDADMYAYTHDWTMRKEQAEKFRDDLLAAQGRLGVDTGTPESSTQASGTSSPGTATPPIALASGTDSPAPAERTPSNIGSLKKAFPSEIDMLVLAHEEVEDPVAAQLRHLRRDSVVAKSVSDIMPVPAGHASLTSIFDMSSIADRPTTGQPAVGEHKKTPLSPIIGSPSKPNAALDDDDEGDGSVSQDEVRIDLDDGDRRLSDVDQASKKKSSMKTTSKVKARRTSVTFSEVPDEVVVKQLTPQQAAKPVEDGWISQGPGALNRIISEQSRDAQLVIVNLPDPDAIVMQNPSAYARYTEAIVRGLPRVIFVHGTGREVYTNAG